MRKRLKTPSKLPPNITGVRRRSAALDDDLSSADRNPPDGHGKLTLGVNYDILPELAGFWLRRAQIYVLRSFDKHTHDLKIRPVETATLLLIGKNRNLSQIALTSALGTDQSTMVAISTRLEELGFIQRRRLATDRRYQALNLTRAGQKLVSVVRKRLLVHNENVLRRLTPSQRKEFIGLLIRVVE